MLSTEHTPSSLPVTQKWWPCCPSNRQFLQSYTVFPCSSAFTIFFAQILAEESSEVPGRFGSRRPSTTMRSVSRHHLTVPLRYRKSTFGSGAGPYLFNCQSNFLELFSRSSLRSNIEFYLTVLENYLKRNYLRVIKHTKNHDSVLRKSAIDTDNDDPPIASRCPISTTSPPKSHHRNCQPAVQ